MPILANNAHRARETIFLLRLTLSLNVLYATSLLWRYLLFKMMIDNPEFRKRYMGALISVDFIENILAFFYPVAILLTILYFIKWFRRAYKNLQQLPDAKLSYSEKWAARSWWIPGINFYRPFRIMIEIWVGMQKLVLHRTSVTKSNRIVWFWWILAIARFLLGIVALSYYLQSSSADRFLIATPIMFVSEVIGILFILVSILLVRKTSLLEKELWLEIKNPSGSIFSVSTKLFPKIP